MIWKIFATPQHIATELARHLCDLSLTERPQHISLSGGSTPKIWFSLLATPLWAKQIRWANLHFWWGDERCVPPESAESNFGAARELLFRHIDIPPANLHRIRGETDVKEELLRYSNKIDLFINKNIEEIPAFDWIILGVGDDGHTASLFPGKTDYTATEWITVAEHPVNGQKRISKTVRLLSAGRRISYLVTGKNKAALLSKIKEATEREPLSMLPWPAANIRAKQGETEWYVDAAAASLFR